MSRSSLSFLVRALGWGLLAAALGAVAIAVAVRKSDWNLSALPRVDATTALGAAARSLDPGFRTVRSGAYDGQFYWAVAVDPLALGAVHRAVDKPSYRYGHPLDGWLGWLLSAGRPRAAPAALAAIGLISLFACAVAATALGVRRGGTGWEGAFVALNVGLISSTANDLGEPLGAALLLGAILAYVLERRAAAWLAFALLPLAKEPLLLVLAGVVIWELAQRRPRAAAFFATAAMPSLIWWTYARVHFGAWFTSGESALGPPLDGWRLSLFDARHGEARGLAVAILVALLVVFALAAIRAVRIRGPVELAYLGLFAVAMCLALNATAAFTTALRNTAFLLVLAPFVIVSPSLRSRPSDRARRLSASVAGAGSGGG